MSTLLNVTNLVLYRKKLFQGNMLGGVQNLNTDDSILFSDVQNNIFRYSPVDDIVFPIIQPEIKEISCIIIINAHFKPPTFQRI